MNILYHGIVNYLKKLDIKKNVLFKTSPCIMLMAGQGKRLKRVNSRKFLLKYKITKYLDIY